jgi:hypothetical protein
VDQLNASVSEAATQNVNETRPGSVRVTENANCYAPSGKGFPYHGVEAGTPNDEPPPDDAEYAEAASVRNVSMVVQVSPIDGTENVRGATANETVTVSRSAYGEGANASVKLSDHG